MYMNNQQNQNQAPINNNNSSSSNNSNQRGAMVPEAKLALNNMKYEIARELGVDYQQAYKGNLSARENGYVGGYMVKRLIEQAERGMANQ